MSFSSWAIEAEVGFGAAACELKIKNAQMMIAKMEDLGRLILMAPRNNEGEDWQTHNRR